MRGQIRGGTVTLKHVMTVRKGGREYRYLRLPTGLVRLPDGPMDAPAFLVAYAAATKQIPQRAITGTIAAMIEAYLRSDRYLSLSPGYRSIIRRDVEAIRAQADDALAKHLKPEHIAADLAPLSPNPANARLKAWRAICGYAVEIGLLKIDPSDGVKRKMPPKSAGHEPWTADDMDAFRERWQIGTVPRAAMELLHWTGARISDAVKIGPGMVGRDGVLAFRQQKTKDFAYVPWSCAVPAYAKPEDRAMMLDALQCLSGHMTFLATAQGRTRSEKALGTLIGESARAAGFDKSAHGLRKARAVALAEGGATAHQIAAWTGHQSLSEVEHYTRAMSRRAAVIGAEQEQNTANSADLSANRA